MRICDITYQIKKYQPATRKLIPSSRFLEIESGWPSVVRLPASYVQEDKVVQHQKSAEEMSRSPSSFPSIFSVSMTCHKAHKGGKDTEDVSGKGNGRNVELNVLSELYAVSTVER